jgi:zinc and cadmium transporter
MDFIYAFGSGLIVSLLALVAVFAFATGVKKISSFLQYMVAFAAGALLGDVFIHILPEFNTHIEQLSLIIFSGIIVSLITEATLNHYHHEDDDHDEPGHVHNESLPWMTTISAAAHNLLDGIAIGASYLISPIVGLTTTMAIIFHEIPHELSHVSVLLGCGWDRRKVLIINSITGLIALLGVVLAFTLNALLSNISEPLTAFAAGQLLYVAMADLVPELHRRAKTTNYFRQILMFGCGVAVMLIIKLLEA